MFQQRQGLLNHAVQLNFREFRGRGAREVQQRVDNLARAETLARNLVQHARLLLVAGYLLREHLRVGRDHRQRCIHFVRHARGQKPDARQLVRLHQAAFQFGAVRNIVEYHEAPDLLHLPRNQRCDGDVERRFTAAVVETRSFERELIQMMNTHLAASTF